MPEKVVSYFKSSRIVTHALIVLLGGGGVYGFANGSGFITEKRLDERLAAEKELRQVEFKGLKDYMKLRFDFLDKNIDHNFKHRGDD